MNKLENLKKALEEFNEELTVVRKNIVHQEKYTFDDMLDYEEISKIQNAIIKLQILTEHISTPRIF